MAPARARGGIDLGGTKIQAVVVDEQHAVLGQARAPTPTTGGPADVAAAMAAAMREAAGAAGIEPAELTHVGVGSPGTVDAAAGTVSSAKNLPGWAGTYPLAKQLRKALGTPVALGNDVQVATDAEARARRRAAATARCSASSGAPASAAGSCSTASRGSAAAARARSATSS